MSTGKSFSGSVALAVIAVAIYGLIVWPVAAYAAAEGVAVEKSETVNVDTSADGSILSVEVESLLKNDNAYQTIADRSTLEAIKGEDGAEPASDESGLVWRAGGKNVTYKGTTSKELPVKIRVTYRLDGAAMSASEIAGKTGEVTIRYDYDNASATSVPINGAIEEIATPFTCITAIMLDGDAFKNISVTNGKVIDDGSNVIVTGMAVPGLKASLGSLAQNANVPDYLEITAHVENFKVKPAMTVVTAGLMSDFDADDLGIADAESTSAVRDAMSAIKGGAADLAGGLGDLASAVDQASSGASDLAYGAGELSSGLYLLAYGTKSQPGLDGMADLTEKMSDGIEDAGSALNALADPQEGLPAAAQALDVVAQAYPDEDEVAQLLMAIKSSDIDEKTKARISAIVSSTQAVKAAAGGVQQGASALSSLSSRFSVLVEQAGSLPAAVKLTADAAAGLYGASAELEGGANRMNEAMGELAAGAHSAAQGSGELADGLETFDREGLAKIVDTIDNDLTGFKKRLNALSQAACAYDNFSGKEPSTPGTVKFVYETAGIE